MSRRYGFHAVVLAVACAPFVVTGCIEPSGFSKPDEIYAAVAMRDGTGGVAGAVAGTGGGTGGGAGVGTGGDGMMLGPCGDVLEDLIKPRCATAGCHNTATGGPLNFEASDLAAELIDAEASSAGCPDQVYIDSVAPEQSLIYLKLAAAPPCGSRMPLIGAELDDEEKACVLGFIEELNAGP